GLRLLPLLPTVSSRARLSVGDLHSFPTRRSSDLNKNLCQRKIYSMSSCERTSSFCPLSSFSFLESCPWCIRVRVAEGRLITNELVDYKRNGRKRNESILKA